MRMSRMIWGGLFDVVQVIELVFFSNINADIRFIETFSPEDA
jgi:hypothetical protein